LAAWAFLAAVDFFSSAALRAARAFLAAAPFFAALEGPGRVLAGADFLTARDDLAAVLVLRFRAGAPLRGADFADFADLADLVDLVDLDDLADLVDLVDFLATFFERLADEPFPAPLTARFAVLAFELARFFCGVTLVVGLRADRDCAADRAGVIASSSRRDDYLIAVRRRTLAVRSWRPTPRDARRRG
jgi:hypothetical protein